MKIKMKKIFAVIAVIMVAIIAAAALSVPREAFADKNAPSDESVPETPPAGGDESGDAAKAERERKAAKEAADRIARERAEAARKRAAARLAAEASKRAAEEARRAASEDMANRWIQTGINHALDGRYQTAINTLRGYVKGYPRSAEAWYWISRAHHAMGDYDKAQAAANIALEIDPYYPPLTKTPSGLEPMPFLTKEQKKEPKASMSVLPVKPALPSGLPLEPVTISFPYLASAGADTAAAVSGDSNAVDIKIYEDSLIISADLRTRAARLRYEPYPPLDRGKTSKLMAENPAFIEIGRWRFRVDRMGIMKNPRVPVAWKGERPREVYFWTGLEWARTSQHKDKNEEEELYYSILLRERGGIAEIAKRSGLEWNEADTPALAAIASHMRYMWMGDVDPGAAAAKAERKTARDGETEPKEK